MTNVPLKADAMDLRVLALTIYGEARGSTHADRIACGWVMRNRAEQARAFATRTRKPHPLFGDGSLTSACKAKWQFSCWNAGDPNRRLLDAWSDNHQFLTDALADPAYQRCLLAALAVITGTEPDPTSSSLHYHTTAMGWPAAWGEKRQPACVIGAHAFYNDVK